MSVEMLKVYTERIKTYERKIQYSYMWIGKNLSEVQDKNLLDGTNYKSISEYALDEFGFEKAKTYYLIDIYKKFFMDEILSNSKVYSFGQYSISQLRFMLDMPEEQLKECNFNMSVREIKEIKLKKSTRVDSETVENTEKLQNCIPGQNIITGVFPDKKEEEKTTTIIVSEIPKAAAPAETKTITTVTETITQNNDFVPNSLDSEVYIRDINRLIHENSEFQNILNSKNKEIKDLKHNLEISENIITYAKEQLHCYFQKSDNGLLVNLVDDLGIYKKTGKLPNKVNFFVNVV